MLQVGCAAVTAAAYDDASCTLYGAVYQGGALVAQSLRPYMGAWRHGDPERLDSAFHAGHTYQKGVYLGRYFGQFGHFLVETLPALGSVESREQNLLFHPWPAVFPDAYISMRYRGYLLEALGIDPRWIRLIREPVSVEELAIPPLDAIIAGRVSDLTSRTFARVRDHALRQGGAGPKRVYLSREHFQEGRRRILNEDVVAEAFRNRGFHVAYPEELPMRDQILLVAEAEFVAGIDGSAMHLCGFMRRGGCAIVIETRPSTAFAHLNRAVGVETVLLRASGTLGGGENCQVVVDIAQLEQRLEFVG